MRKLAKEGGLSLDAALDRFEARNADMTKQGIDIGRVAFSCAFGRGMDYYTGFVFELRDGESDEPLVAGGRYDDLLTRLGSQTPIPAVGFSVWIERLAGGAA
jgi:ATP phosphoribosyltransferase regulatory subunit